MSQRKLFNHLKEQGFLIPEKSALQMEFGLSDREFLRLNHKGRNRIINNLIWNLQYREADRLRDLYTNEKSKEGKEDSNV